MLGLKRQRVSTAVRELVNGQWFVVERERRGGLRRRNTYALAWRPEYHEILFKSAQPFPIEGSLVGRLPTMSGFADAVPSDAVKPDVISSEVLDRSDGTERHREPTDKSAARAEASPARPKAPPAVERKRQEKDPNSHQSRPTDSDENRPGQERITDYGWSAADEDAEAFAALCETITGEHGLQYATETLRLVRRGARDFDAIARVVKTRCAGRNNIRRNSYIRQIVRTQFGETESQKKARLERERGASEAAKARKALRDRVEMIRVAWSGRTSLAREEVVDLLLAKADSLGANPLELARQFVEPPDDASAPSLEQSIADYPSTLADSPPANRGRSSGPSVDREVAA